MNREEMIQKLDACSEWDLCIIGGGATGLGIAVDAASRGLKTLLLERGDFAGGTSSRSTKLVHGGVRYLQQGNIRLVREALKERGILLNNAPQTVHNLGFIIPNYKWWEKSFYGIGLKLYDAMAGKWGLGPSRMLSREETLQLAPTLDPRDLRGGILYHDGQFDDARLAIQLARTAVREGAALLNYFPVNGFLKMKGKLVGAWAKDSLTQKEYEIRSKVVINATGVFTDSVMQMDDGQHEEMIQPSQGIHLVVDREFLPGENAILIPRTDDGRVLFAVPWHGKLLLGTTDTLMKTISAEPVPLKEEIDFILEHIGRYLSKDPGSTDIRSVFAGLRPLLKSGSLKTAAISRDHQIIPSDSGLLSITGGKWTTYRRMAEETVDRAMEQAGLEKRKCITRDLPIESDTDSPVPPDISMLSDEALRPVIRQVVRNEMCVTVEDFLSRRTRQLLLDAGIAINRAPFVAREMAVLRNRDESWIQEQINNFKAIAINYLQTPKPLNP